MKVKFLFVFFIIFCLFSSVLLAEKKKKHKKKNKNNKSEKLPNGLPTPNSIRPSTVSPELLCDSCQAIIFEALKSLKKATKESDVLFYLSDVCNPKKYNIYHFPPPDMKTGCETFYGAYSESVEKILINRPLDKSKDVLMKELCFDTTQVCTGVDFNNIKHMDDSIMVDGEPVKIETLNARTAESKKQAEKSYQNSKEKNKDL